ncbi:hypothetical protein LR69_03821 [Geobacillus sp. BCO2]|nr:hypothetical protein LR69_03821 [Geobacillus sp. BCO2]
MSQPAVSTTPSKNTAPSILEWLYKHGTLLAILAVITYFGITQDRFLRMKTSVTFCGPFRS